MLCFIPGDIFQHVYIPNGRVGKAKELWPRYRPMCFLIPVWPSYIILPTAIDFQYPYMRLLAWGNGDLGDYISILPAMQPIR